MGLRPRDNRLGRSDFNGRLLLIRQRLEHASQTQSQIEKSATGQRRGLGSNQLLKRFCKSAKGVLEGLSPVGWANGENGFDTRHYVRPNNTLE